MEFTQGIQLVSNNTFFAVIVFQNPRSPQWPLVRELCRTADMVIEEKGGLAAGFKQTIESLNLLISISHIASEWKSAHLFVKRRKIGHIFSVHWLQCYIKSMQCSDKNAWCLDITKAPRKVDDFRDLNLRFIIDTTPNPLAPIEPEPVFVNENYICPCKALAGFPWGHKELPCSLKDQFQAFAVERGYHDCPNFDIAHFKPIYPVIDT